MTPEEWKKEADKVVADMFKLLHRYPWLRVITTEITKNREAVRIWEKQTGRKVVKYVVQG